MWDGAGPKHPHLKIGCPEAPTLLFVVQHVYLEAKILVHLPRRQVNRAQDERRRIVPL